LSWRVVCFLMAGDALSTQHTQHTHDTRNTHAPTHATNTRTLQPPEAMAEAYGVKRSQKAALLDRLNVELGEFA
jgi:hypothetical protein